MESITDHVQQNPDPGTGETTGAVPKYPRNEDVPGLVIVHMPDASGPATVTRLHVELTVLKRQTLRYDVAVQFILNTTGVDVTTVPVEEKRVRESTSEDHTKLPVGSAKPNCAAAVEGLTSTTTAAATPAPKLEIEAIGAFADLISISGFPLESTGGLVTSTVSCSRVDDWKTLVPALRILVTRDNPAAVLRELRSVEGANPVAERMAAFNCATDVNVIGVIRGAVHPTHAVLFVIIA